MVAFGIMFNHGQACCAGSRVYVEEEIYDAFLEKMTAYCKNLPVGDPSPPPPSTDLRFRSSSTTESWNTSTRQEGR